MHHNVDLLATRTLSAETAATAIQRLPSKTVQDRTRNCGGNKAVVLRVGWGGVIGKYIHTTPFWRFDHCLVFSISEALRSQKAYGSWGVGWGGREWKLSSTHNLSSGYYRTHAHTHTWRKTEHSYSFILLLDHKYSSVLVRPTIAIDVDPQIIEEFSQLSVLNLSDVGLWH